ncbi:MAG: type III pantothenate kinase [Clostridia bacterium]|nr:type III pantothenate kinase [Clostridia bacterium]
MILVIDMGNTNITLGAYDGERLVYEARLATARQRTAYQYAVEMIDIFRLNGSNASDYEGAILCSVVPELTDIIANAVNKSTGKMPVILDSNTDTGLEIAIDTISEIGSDLIAACVGAKAKYKMPCLISDLGTATKIIVLNENGAFRGCTISPGMGISLRALASETSQLPNIRFSAPSRTIGTNTVECMQSGIVFGTAAMLDGLTERICDEMGYGECTMVVTGGYGRCIVTQCRKKMVFDENLVLDGLAMIYYRNTENCNI